MIFCAKCVLPSTRPGLLIDKSDGVCNACKNHATKSTIDWNQRELAFRELVKSSKKKNGAYDCIIPVSGGKDSTWQVIVCLGYGLHPLCVTWKSPKRTPLGQKNLDNLIRLGVDHIDFQVNPKVERAFSLASLKKYGTPMIPMHMWIYNYPLQLATNLSIPLVVWGENSAFEYGSTEEETKGFSVTQEWVQKYAAIHNTTYKDWVTDAISANDLAAYQPPNQALLQQRNVFGIFLGHYFEWDPIKTQKVATEHGFTSAKDGPRVGHYDFADIDDEFISIHHYVKWYKFGFTRLFDNLSLEIRNHRMTREKALEIIRNTPSVPPMQDIRSYCDYVDISEKSFFEILETFRNRDIWSMNNGRWSIENFLIPGYFDEH